MNAGAQPPGQNPQGQGYPQQPQGVPPQQVPGQPAYPQQQMPAAPQAPAYPQQQVPPQTPGQPAYPQQQMPAAPQAPAYPQQQVPPQTPGQPAYPQQQMPAAPQAPAYPQQQVPPQQVPQGWTQEQYAQYLAQQQAQVPGQAPAAAPAPAASGKKRILIVEDERSLGHALDLKLRHEGYETRVASTGTEGLREAQSGGYDLMLLDLILPELDGFTLLKQLSTQPKTMPIVILSNLGQEEDKARVSQYGVDQYCVKSNMPLAAIINTVKSLTT